MTAIAASPVPGPPASYELLVEQSPVAIAITGAVDQRLRYVNDTFVRLTGIPRGELLGRTAAELGLGEGADSQRPLIEQVRARGYVRGHEQLLLTRHGPRRVSLFINPLRYQGEECLLTNLFDLTGRPLDETRRSALTLIRDLVDVAEIEAGTRTPRAEPVDLPGLVRGVVELLRPLVDRRRIRVSTRVDPQLDDLAQDAGRLRLVLYMLLANALAAAPSWSEVRVSIAPAGPGRFSLEVDDEGPEAGSGGLARLLDGAPAGAAMGEALEGGLGLGLVKQLAEAQGGKLGLREAGGRGNTFFVDLPRRTGRG